MRYLLQVLGQAANIFTWEHLHIWLCTSGKAVMQDCLSGFEALMVHVVLLFAAGGTGLPQGCAGHEYLRAGSWGSWMLWKGSCWKGSHREQSSCSVSEVNVVPRSTPQGILA